MAGVRSKAYPAIDLSSAVKRAEIIQKYIGNGVYFNRETMAKGMGYKSLSGVATRAIAALVHFGLLERKKDTYTLSDLAVHIVLPISDEDKQEAIRTAVKEPELYRELIQNYEGKHLPAALGNILAVNHGINPNSSAQAALAFVESLRYAGMMNGDVVDSMGERSEEGIDNEEAPSSGEVTFERKKEPSSATNTIIRKLPSGVEIGFPSELDFAVLTGAFAEEIKAIDDRAQKLLHNTRSEPGGVGTSDEEDRATEV